MRFFSTRKNMRTKRTFSPFTVYTDYKGRRIARVEAAKDAYFELLESDWRAARKHVGPTWYLSGNGSGGAYVMAAPRPGLGPVPLARIIKQAREGERVKYMDGNTLNLRPENLKVDRGYSKYAVPAGGYKTPLQHRL